nr:hypothetical protein [Tanacetum cinerariifolium]
DAGDQVLVWVAEQLKECLRPYDVLARMGGDEFVVVIDGLDFPEHAAKVAEKLIDRVSARRVVDGIEATLGASIGIAVKRAHGDRGQGFLYRLPAADQRDHGANPWLRGAVALESPGRRRCAFEPVHSVAGGNP